MDVKGRGVLVAGALAAGATAVGLGVTRRTRRQGSLPRRQDGKYVTARSVTVDRSLDEVRNVFRDAERLSVALDRPVTVEQNGDEGWTCRVMDVPGDSHPVEAAVRQTGTLLSWQVKQAPVPHEGHLELAPAPGDRGTEIRVELSYPGTRTNRLAATLRGRDPDQALRTTLRRLKSVLECGQVVSTMRDPSGRGPVAERVTRMVREKLATGGRP